MLTKRQKQILDFITKYNKRYGVSPALEEIKKHFRLKSVSGIHQHIEALKKKGYLNKTENQPRGIEIRKSNKLIRVPLLGIIAAGQPIEAIQDRETIAVPENKLPKNGEIYALKVVGNSMIDENINDGDIVLVQQQSIAENGQRVVALIDGAETTLKKFYKEKNYIRLQPANKTMEPIIIKRSREFAIQGVVIDIINDINTTNPRNVAERIVIKQKINKKPYFQTDNIEIYNEDILKTDLIPEQSIDLIVTSPPYNVDIHYNSHNDNLTYNEYLQFTREWVKKCFDLAKSEGRFLLNIPLDKNKGGQKSVGADLTKIAKEIGWKYHSTIIWNEGNISRRTAWGSFMSASAPYVIAPVELILVLYKDSWKKTGGSRKNDITKKEFMDWTNGVWTFTGQSKRGAGGHPAPFPIELPRRCIKLFSFVGDTVLDPFLGSGSTLIASYLHDRKGIGVEIDEKYCDIAVSRLHQEAKAGQNNIFSYAKK